VAILCLISKNYSVLLFTMGIRQTMRQFGEKTSLFNCFHLVLLGVSDHIIKVGVFISLFLACLTRLGCLSRKAGVFISLFLTCLTTSLRIEFFFSLNVSDLGLLSYIIYILITIKVSQMRKVTSQALYKRNIEVKEKRKKINESSDDF